MANSISKNETKEQASLPLAYSIFQNINAHTNINKTSINLSSCCKS